MALTDFVQPVTTRGYTGHEMVDDYGIIHLAKLSLTYRGPERFATEEFWSRRRGDLFALGFVTALPEERLSLIKFGKKGEGRTEARL